MISLIPASQHLKHQERTKQNWQQMEIMLEMALRTGLDVWLELEV